MGTHAARFTRLAVAVALSIVVLPHPASAHCDALDGPVVNAAREALARGVVTTVLSWVGKDQEPELRRVFSEVVRARALGPDAAAVADRWFFETVVRLHRASEGEPYTGLKPAGRTPPSLAATDKALEAGSVDALIESLTGDVRGELRRRLSRALNAKKHAHLNVAAGREFVREYSELMTYIEALHGAAPGEPHHEFPGS